MGGPKVGDKAPDFILPAQDGRTVSLHEFAGTKNVVLYFYPKDFTMGCTQETKAFAESYERLLEMGAEVIGISSDSAESHNGFAKGCGARFPLLADVGGKVRADYGAKSMGLIPDRITFVIDKKGVVRHKFSSQFNPRQHIAEAIEALKIIKD
ncbi:MAG: peroxiredoxin [Nitrososphaerota archaeon]|nr:peroxiredoxin [Nitrososphaerota archaeon]MDG6917966.1 peroxiredoxin [Nitrososphaerota archaeon]